jgi:hypothetical protein
MQVQNIAISDGTYRDNKPVVYTYTAHLAVGNQCNNIFTIESGDLLKHIDANLCLRSSSESSVLFSNVKDIFLAPKANFYPRPDLTMAISSGKKVYYGDGRGVILDRLVDSGRLVAQEESINPITNILMEGLNSTNTLSNIEQLTNIKSIIDYVFTKPHLLLSVLLTLRNEGGAQCLFADAGNVPHRNQLILNMSPSRINFADKLHSGTQFGIASYFQYGRRIYKSVFDLDIADYIIISISYYPTVSQGNIERPDIVNYYDPLLDGYKYSVYSFHLWRHSLYGGFAGTVRGTTYVNDGYTLRPECACKALKLQIDAQQQQHFKEGWYAILYFPTAFYMLLLYLAMEVKEHPDKHNNKVINAAINKLEKIKGETDSTFYKKVIKLFVEELGNVFFEILRKGIDYLKIIANYSKNYKNPLQMLWNYCKGIIVVPTHKGIIDRYKIYAPNSNKIDKLRERTNMLTEYIDNSFESTSGIYTQILREEKKFFDN